MKKILAALITTLVTLVLIAGCSGSDSTAPEATNNPEAINESEAADDWYPDPTDIPYSLRASSDSFLEEKYQVGEIRLAPGEEFTVNLEERGENFPWREQLEIINEGVVEQVNYQHYQPSPDFAQWYTWTFQAVNEGVCLINFKTQGHGQDVHEWIYTVAVEVMPPSVTTFPVEFVTVGPTSEDISDEIDGLILNRTIHDRTYDLSGDLDGIWVRNATVQSYLTTCRWFSTNEGTFTGTVNGNSGTLFLRGFSWGVYQPPDGHVGETSWNNAVWVIISGTEELADLRGTICRELTAVPVEPATTPPTYELVGPWSGTFWFLDQGQ